MERPRKPRRVVWRVLARSGLVLPVLMVPSNELNAGDWWRIDNHSTIPKGAITPTYGTHVSNIFAGQYARGQAEKFVIYKHEWYQGGTQPGPAARKHWAAIFEKLCIVPGPIIVQPIEPEEVDGGSHAESAKLNEERRRRVVEYLASRGDPDADRRVILGYPTAEGLYGIPANLLGTRYLFSQSGIGAFGGGGGFGGGGFGGGMGGMGGGNFF